jgi:hypothetical protein
MALLCALIGLQALILVGGSVVTLIEVARWAGIAASAWPIGPLYALFGPDAALVGALRSVTPALYLSGLAALYLALTIVALCFASWLGALWQATGRSSA